jgi:GNAT superfamily N-acetyltransferase
VQIKKVKWKFRMLRAALYADIPRLMEIRGSVLENRLPHPNAVTLADYIWFIDHAKIHVWEDAIVQGFSAGDPRDASIWALFIHPTYEGRGIGQTLIQAACKSLHDAGCVSITLSTEPGSRAHRFYERNGWIARGRTTSGEMKFEKAI